MPCCTYYLNTAFVKELVKSNNSSILTTNWVICIEKYLDKEGIGFNYGLEIHPVNQYVNSLQSKSSGRVCGKLLIFKILSAPLICKAVVLNPEYDS